MAYDGRVYRILIASPSDVEEERDTAVSVIQEWNDLNSFIQKTVLLPLRWETHTAPELGTRPQEIINRSIVDECDLLVGIFWTRLGTPTGAADSGTLEEIERVVAAGKPALLYFSKVGIDPDDIDAKQINKLRDFKKSILQKGLVDTYETRPAFRDKFSVHLQRHVSELRKAEVTGPPPLKLNFFSLATAEALEQEATLSCKRFSITDFESVPENQRAKVENIAKAVELRRSYVPLVLGLENITSSSIRNPYIELDISSNNNKAVIVEASSMGPDQIQYASAVLSSGTSRNKSPQDIQKKIQRMFAQFEPNTLQKITGGWRILLEWEAIQTKRLRIVKPFILASCEESTKFKVKAKIFSDSLPRHTELDNVVNVEVTRKSATLKEILPNWRELIKENQVWGTTLNLSSSLWDKFGVSGP
jgi:hypothetical protein